MPKISTAKDAHLAQRGYVRSSIVARLLQLSVSGTGRWIKREKINYVSMHGVCWVHWGDLRKYVNTYKNKKAQGLAEIVDLPATALAALQLAQRLGQEPKAQLA